MEKLLGEEYGQFLSCYEKEALRGIRFNRRKARKDTVEKLIAEWNLDPVAWCPAGYSYQNVRPGLSAYHDAGVFYMQEPSAMCVVEEAGISEGDIVLDLCAAPGGKSTQAAERCFLLVSNEIIPGRAKILSSNIERLGFENTLVCSAEPARLSQCLDGFFDVVVTDAPCSGEGMMRRDEIAITEWSEENVRLCADRQKMILDEAAKMVRPGGKLVYSTCTFEPVENEEQVNSFLDRSPEFRRISMKRIWPHRENGEGHFCAVLQNGQEETNLQNKRSENSENTYDLTKMLKSVEKRLFAEHIHILRSGLVRGEWFTDKKGHKFYEPSHAEIMASVFETCENGVNLKDERLADSYLHGNVLRPEDGQAEYKGNDGFCGVYFDGYPLGVGKRNGTVIKNHLPKGLRKMG